MTLEELLALLPDNTTGQIDAADLRTIVTELFDKTATLAAVVEANTTQIVTLGQNMDSLFTQVQDHETRIAALEAAP